MTRRAPDRLRGGALVLALCAEVLVAHGWCLNAGFFHDDYAHRVQLREADWGPAGLVRAARLGTTTHMVRYWWSEGQFEWQPFRPLAFALMKLEHTLGGYGPGSMHAFSLGWHVVNGLLVGVLAWRLFGRARWAWIAAMLFAAHPGPFLAVQWIACQTELVVTCFCLLGTLAYLPRIASAENAERSISAGKRTGGTLLALACYLAALLCRENAIILPVLLVVLDWAVGLRPRSAMFARCALFVVPLAAYVALRSAFHEGFTPPARPHVVPPGDPQFWQFLADKLAYYLLCLYAYVPCSQVGILEFLQSHRVWLYVGGGAIGAGLLGLELSLFRAVPAARALLAWSVLAFVPVLAVFAGSHHLYLPAAGMAAAGGAFFGCLRGDLLAGRTSERRRRAADRLAAMVLVLYVAGSAVAGWVLTDMAAVEQRLIAAAARSPRPIRAGDHLLYIDMPIVASFTTPAITDRTGAGGLTPHALTISPRSSGAGLETQTRRIDEFTLRVTSPAEPYFAGEAGRTLLFVGRDGAMPRTGESFATELFDVTVLEADAGGVRSLEFRFRRPLDDPTLHWFVNRPATGVLPFRPAGPAAPGSSTDDGGAGVRSGSG